jgi:DNA polymerase
MNDVSLMGLDSIGKEIRNCSKCKGIGKPVPGEGPDDARIVLVGMAPGKKESETGRPFVGRSGTFLDKMLEKAGINRDEVYITSPVKYYPGDRNLRKEEISHGASHLKKQIDIIEPEIIVLMGAVAAKALLPDENIKVTDDHGRTFRKDGIMYIITFHPAAGMRFPEMGKMMESDFRKLAHY